MGDTVEVTLMEAAPVTGGLRFELAESGRARSALKLAPRKPGHGAAPDKRPLQAKKALNFIILPGPP